MHVPTPGHAPGSDQGTTVYDEAADGEVGRPFRDPRTLGCRCTECPLGQALRETNQWHPVMPEENPGTAAIIAEAPGEREVANGRPLVGRSGKETMNALAAVGMGRQSVSWSNAILCRPPGNDYRAFVHQNVTKPNRRIKARNRKISTENKEAVQRQNAVVVAAVAAGESLESARHRAARQHPTRNLLELVPSPVEACRPQLLAQIERTPDLLLMGGLSYSAVTGRAKPVKKIRGSFNYYWLVVNGDGSRAVRTPPEGWEPGQPTPPNLVKLLRIVPTQHPAFVLRSPANRVLFRGDVGRFYRWLHGKLDWVKPWLCVAPGPEQLEAWLWHPSIPWHATDIETKGIETYDLGWSDEAVDEGLAKIQITQREGEGDRAFQARQARLTKAKERVKARRPHPARMRCITFSTPDGSMVVPIRSIDGHTGMEKWYGQGAAARVIELIKRWLVDPSRQKIGHNWGYFDVSQMYYVEFGVLPQNYYDTILFFRGAHSELDRDLYTLGTLLSDVPDWKSGGSERNVAVNPRSDEELHTYNGLDGVVDARCFAPLVAQVQERGQLRAVMVDHSVQSIAREMHNIGIGRVNEEKRAKKERVLVEKASMLRARMIEVAGKKFNPNSVNDLTTLFVDDWNLPILERTDTLEPSWEDEALRKYRQSGLLKPDQLALFDDLRAYRTATKSLGYVKAWRRWNDYRVGSDGVSIRGGHAGPDGRLHPHWNCHTPRTGRISGSNPAPQNVESDLRECIEPEDGHCYAAADYDQIELRLAAAVARIKSYLRVFDLDGDPHAVTAELIYGDTFRKALKFILTPEQWTKYRSEGAPPKADDRRLAAFLMGWGEDGGEAIKILRAEGNSYASEADARAAVDVAKSMAKLYKTLRTFAKTFVYAVIYGGTAMTVYQSVSAAEDPKTGKLLFPDMALDEIRSAYNSFMRNAPELKAWWEDAWAFARQHGYITEPVLGRRRDFPQFERNEILNMPIQGAAAAIMALGLIKLRSRLRPGQFGKHTGIVAQVHDFGMVEVPESEGKWAAEVIEDSFTMSFDFLAGVRFGAKAGVAPNWMAA